jgi:hypothetical protein
MRSVVTIAVLLAGGLRTPQAILQSFGSVGAAKTLSAVYDDAAAWALLTRGIENGAQPWLDAAVLVDRGIGGPLRGIFVLAAALGSSPQEMISKRLHDVWPSILEPDRMDAKTTGVVHCPGDSAARQAVSASSQRPLSERFCASRSLEYAAKTSAGHPLELANGRTLSRTSKALSISPCRIDVAASRTASRVASVSWSLMASVRLSGGRA